MIRVLLDILVTALIWDLTKFCTIAFSICVQITTICNFTDVVRRSIKRRRAARGSVAHIEGTVQIHAFRLTSLSPGDLTTVFSPYLHLHMYWNVQAS